MNSPEAETTKLKDTTTSDLFNEFNKSRPDPIEIVRAQYVGRTVKLTYKNVSGKKIDAIKFKWIGEDAFGDPETGGGITDESLGDGKTTSATWATTTKTGKKIIKAWAFEIAFSDGTKWEN